MIKLIGLALVLASVSSSGWAADWWMVAWNRNGEGDAIAYVDKSGVARLDRPGVMAVTGWTIYRIDQSADFGAYRSEKYRLIVDCGTRAAGIERRSFYSGFGSLLSQTKPEPPALAVPAEGSLLEQAARFVCAQGKPGAAALPVYDPAKDAEQRFWLEGRQNR